MISALRFFAIVPLHSRYMLIALVAVLLSGVAMLIVDPTKGGNALGPLALLQMLAAASGFAVSARRGHFDLLLTAGPRRADVALTHLGLSILPGIVVWWLLGIVEMGVARTLSPHAFASGSVVALTVISAASWALTVRLPRLSGGIAWLLGTAVWVVGWSGGTTLIDVMGDTTVAPLTRAIVITLCPFVLLGRRLSAGDFLAVAPSVLLAAIVTAAAVMWITRMDVALESAQ